jgi:hypothetical protein
VVFLPGVALNNALKNQPDNKSLLRITGNSYDVDHAWLIFHESMEPTL